MMESYHKLQPDPKITIFMFTQKAYRYASYSQRLWHWISVFRVQKIILHSVINKNVYSLR